MLRLGRAIGRVLGNGMPATVLIGKDTRVSGYMLESALEAGLVAAGADVRLLGPMPTPAVAQLTRELGGSAGIVISASHNPYYDNGIKLFSAHGEKLEDAVELAIERELDNAPHAQALGRIGKAVRVDDAAQRYLDFCLATVPGLTCVAGRLSWIARTARPITSRRGCLPNSAPTSMPSACSLMASTSITVGRPTCARCRIQYAGMCRSRHRLRRRRRPRADGRPGRCGRRRRRPSLHPRARQARARRAARSGGRHPDVELRHRARHCRARRRSCAPTSATVTRCRCSSNVAACSAAKRPATRCASTR